MSSEYWTGNGYGIDVTNINIDKNKFADFIKNHKPALFEELGLSFKDKPIDIWNAFDLGYESYNTCEYGPFAAFADIIGEECNVRVVFWVDMEDSRNYIVLPDSMPWQLTKEEAELDSPEKLERIFQLYFEELDVVNIKADTQTCHWFG